MEPEKIGRDNLIYKTEIETDIKSKYRDTKGIMGGGCQMSWEIEVDIYTLLTLCIK